MNGRTAQHIVLVLLKYKCVQHARAQVLSLHQMTQTKQISCSLRNALNVILELVNYNEHNHQSTGINRLQNQFHDLRYQVTVIGKSTNSPVLLMFETLTMTELLIFSSVKVKDCCAEPF